MLREFIDNINNTGGLTNAVGTEDALPSDMPTPAGAPEWIDLAVTYLHACQVFGVEPEYAEDFNDDDYAEDAEDDAEGFNDISPRENSGCSRAD